MQNQKTLRQRVEQLFGFPAMKMPWSLYIAQLNEAGKLTARSLMDMMTVVLETLEQQEEEIKDNKLMSESHTPSIEELDKPMEVIRPTVEDIAGDGRDGDLEIKEPMLQEKVSKVTEKVVDKGIVDAIVGEPVKESKLPKELQEEKS